jgi:hypothetical protein
VGQISFTIDSWSDQSRKPYLAITAHWIAEHNDTGALRLKTALIAFHHIRGGHDGVSLAHVVLGLLNRAEIITKVRQLRLFVALRLGFRTGTVRVGLNNTAPVPADTAPTPGRGTHRTRTPAVLL